MKRREFLRILGVVVGALSAWKAVRGSVSPKCSLAILAGEAMDEAIRQYLRRAHGVIVGPQMAERIRIEAGARRPSQAFEVCSRDTVSGLPRRAVFTAEDITRLRGDPTAF